MSNANIAHEKTHDSVSSYLKNFLMSKKPNSQEKTIVRPSNKSFGAQKTIACNLNLPSKHDSLFENKRHSTKQMSTSINKGKDIEEKDHRFKYSVYQSILNNYAKKI